MERRLADLLRRIWNHDHGFIVQHHEDEKVFRDLMRAAERAAETGKPLVWPGAEA